MSREAGMPLWIGAVVVCALAAMAGGEVAYTVTDLGTFAETGSFGMAINNDGQVVGSAAYGAWEFLWDPEKGVTDLTAAIGEPRKIWVQDINDKGEFTYVVLVGDGRDSYVWDGTGQPTYIGPVAAVSVNNAGMVLAASYPNGWDPSATVVWDACGGIRNVGFLPGGRRAEGRGLNNLGQVVGESTTDIPAAGHPLRVDYRDKDVQHHAFLWSEAEGMRDLGTLGGDIAWARAVNDPGTVVGASYTGVGDDVHAFIWDEAGGMRDLGLLPGSAWSEAVAINNRGEVIGASVFDTAPPGLSSCGAFLWDSTNGMRPLTDLVPNGGWYDMYPIDINDRGQILAEVYFEGPDVCSIPRAVVLTPVPEPGLPALALCAFCALILRKNRALREWHCRLWWAGRGHNTPGGRAGFRRSFGLARNLGLWIMRLAILGR